MRKTRRPLAETAQDAIGRAASGGPLSIVYRDPRSLKFWDQNPRHNDAAAKKLAALIEVHGFKVPVTMRKEDGIVYKGNCRLKAALLLGLGSIPVMVVSYPSVQGAIDEAIGDNVASEWAVHNEDALYDVLQERTAVEVAKATGLEVSQIEGLRADYRGMDEDAPPDGFKEFDEDVETDYKCPKCEYEWSGKPK